MPKIESFTTKQVATLFGVTVHSIRDWIEDPNGMRAIKIGASYYISADEVRRYYEIKHGHIPKIGKP
jgi:excisionase family DNA binding protein